MTTLCPNEQDPALLWAEIHRLRAELQGPEGYSSWKDAAVAERRRRVELQHKLAEIHELAVSTNCLGGR